MAGNLKQKNLELDTFLDKNGKPVTYFSQGDRLSDKLYIDLSNRDEELNITTADQIRIDFLKPDGKRVFQYCLKEDAAKGIVSVILNSQTVAAAGEVFAEVTVMYPAGVRVVTRQFSFYVNEAIASDASVASMDFAPMLDKAIEAGDKLQGVDIDAIVNAGQLAASAQRPKITLDNGGASISITDTTKNILDEIKAKGQGMHTIYCAGGVQGQTPNNKSWRGVAFLNSPSYGLVWAKDFNSKFYTNYMDNGTWLGWVEHSDATLTQNTKVTLDDGDALVQAKLATDDILAMVNAKGKGFYTIYAGAGSANVPSGASLRGFANMQGATYGYIIAMDYRNKMWTNYRNGGEWLGWVNVNGDIKNGRQPLNLTTDATPGSADPSIYTRRGNTVTIRMDAMRKVGSSSAVVANLQPEALPTETYKVREVATDGTVVEVLVRTNGEIHFNTEGKRLLFAFTYVVD